MMARRARQAHGGQPLFLGVDSGKVQGYPLFVQATVASTMDPWPQTRPPIWKKPPPTTLSRLRPKKQNKRQHQMKRKRTGSGEVTDSENSEPEEPAEEHAKAERKFRWPALRRSADDRLVAGVAGGLGDFFGIDPVIVRIGFIVLTFFGGVGLALYFVSWLIVPLGDSGSILANALRSGAPRRFRNLTGIVLIAFGLFVTAILSRNVFEVFVKVSSTAPYLALALIVAGIGLVFWPRRATPPLDTPAEPLAAPTTATVPSPPSAAGSEWPGANMGDEPQGTKASWGDRRAERRAQRRGQSTVTFLTLAALLVLTGGAILLDRLDMERVLLGEFFAVALLVVAVGLLVSVFVGRNWALIVLGVLLLAPLVVFSGSDISWWSGFGDVETVPEDISSLDRDVKHGIGNLVVDLRSLDRDSIAVYRTSVYRPQYSSDRW